jgi:hypothetical protein
MATRVPSLKVMIRTSLGDMPEKVVDAPFVDVDCQFPDRVVAMNAVLLDAAGPWNMAGLSGAARACADGCQRKSAGVMNG